MLEWLGMHFLESPGNPYDGIDNDGDAITIGGLHHLQSQILTHILLKRR